MGNAPRLSLPNPFDNSASSQGPNQTTNSNNYISATAALKAQVLSDQSIDNTSRQELLDQLTSGQQSIDKASAGGSTNSDTYAGITNQTIAAVSVQETTDQGSDPLYVGRRFLQDSLTSIQNQPGRLQTQSLLSSDKSTSGAPTLLTAAVPVTGGPNGR